VRSLREVSEFLASAPRGNPMESTQTSVPRSFTPEASGSAVQEHPFYFGWAGLHSQAF
jgi:hypothetical protein